jgi:tryptophan synthase alpha chain
MIRLAKRRELSTVFFLAPTTTRQRIKKIVKASTGFVYYVSLTGVTGAQKMFSKNNVANIRAAKRLANKPVCIGFGVSTPTQVKTVARMADGVIVGSAIVKQIEKNKGKLNLVKNVSRFVRSLTQSLL